MRSCGWLVLAACSGDPSLDVSVRHPAGYDITQTVVTVYFGDDISCDEIAFGDRTETELAAITADEVDVTGGGRIEVSRLGGKSIVARGYDRERRFLAAGCEDLGEVTAGTDLAITTQPTSVVAIDPAQPDRPFSERTILVNMTDPHGTALEGTVSWQLTGPAGAVEPPPSAGVPTRNGEARIEVKDLGTPGPQGLRIRVPWATAPLPIVTAFDLSKATTIQLGGGSNTSRPSCDVRGRAGKLPSLICLTQATGTHRDAVEITWDTDRYTTRLIQIPAAIDNQQAVFVDHDGSADEPVYVLGDNPAGLNNWYRLGAASGSTVLFEGSITRVVYVARCAANATTALVGVQTGLSLLSRRRFFTPSGATLPGPNGVVQDGEVFSGGCVDDVDQVEHQAVVVSSGTSDAVLTLITPTGPVPISGAKLDGSGFVTVEDQGAREKRFAGTRIQASGTVVFEAVLSPQGSSYKLVERAEREAAAPPLKILAGQLDQDGDTDLMWDLAAVLRRRVFQVSLAKQVSGVPLTAMTSGATQTTAATPADFVIGNLDGGSADEMIVFTQSAVTIYSAD